MAQLKNSYHYAPQPLNTQARPSSQNALKHGGCSKTLILPHESIADWELVLSHWCAAYLPREDSLEFDFVLKAAQAEFRRLRADRNYDDFLASLETRPPFTWSPEEIKMHDLMLRYQTSASREFQRQYHLLEHHYRTHKPIPAEPVADETTEEAEAPEQPARHGIHAVSRPRASKAPQFATSVPPDSIIFTNSKGERIG